MDEDFIFEPVSERHVQDIVGLYDRVYGGSYPLIRQPEKIRDMIKSGRYIWHLGFVEDAQGKKLIGSMAGERHEWNNSFEIGKGAVDKDYRSKHVGFGVFIKVMDEAKMMSDLQWGYIRNIGMVGMLEVYRKYMKKIGEERPIVMVGFVPGKFKVGDRENHGIGMILNDDTVERRIAPERGIHHHSPIIQKIISGFGFNGRVGEYPEDVFVGPEGDKLVTVNSGDVFYEELPNNTIIVNAVKGGVPALKEFLSKVKDSEYIETAIPADKVDAIRELSEEGFGAYYYQPAWGTIGDDKYDCLRMVRHKESVSVDDNVAKMVEEFTEGFSDI